MFLAVEPIARKDVLVGINEHSFSSLDAVAPLAIILAFIAVDQPTDAVLVVLLKVSCIYVTVGVGVLAFALAKLLLLYGLLRQHSHRHKTIHWDKRQLLGPCSLSKSWWLRLLQE